MNLFERFIYSLMGEMNTPTPFGWFHLLCLILTFGMVFLLFNFKNKYSEKQLKVVLGIYGVVALVLEVLKQVMWSFNYDSVTGVITWDYEWYAAPFQLCTTPIYVSLICLFLKKGKTRDSLLSYLSYVTILGSIMTMLLPESCFTSDILVNIHTMFLHCGSFVVSVYLIINKEVKVTKESLLSALCVFLGFVFVALLMNIIVYKSGVLNGETFNMFYISPYFLTHLPVYNIVQGNTSYIFYLLFYIASIYIGSLIIFGLFNIKKIIK